MRIIHLLIGAGAGGGQEIALRLARAARDRVDEALFVAPRPGPIAERTRRSAYVCSSSIAASTASRPRRAHSSSMRAVASRCAASCARRSPRRSSGFLIRATSVSIVSPSSRVGGITTPSSSSMREWAGRLPGSRPPTSAWCARLAAKPTWL